MITTFEAQTHPLTEDEKAILPKIVRGLSDKKGRNNAVTSTFICSKMNNSPNMPFKLDGPRLRKIINHIRTKGLLKSLCSSSRGYFIANTNKELDDYLCSLDERISAIQQIRNSFN